MKYEGVRGHSDIARDVESKAIVNMDNGSLNAYKLKRKREKEVQKTLDSVDELRNEVGELKSMVSQLLNTINTNR